VSGHACQHCRAFRYDRSFTQPIFGDETMSDTSGFKCLICGYVHTGAQAPATCPVCGVGADQFEPYSEQAQPEPASAVEAHRCMVCGYVHEGDAPPDSCPVCSVDSSLFEPIAGSAGDRPGTDEQGHLVVLGGGIAGVTAADHARRTAPGMRITLIDREASLPYYRLNLTRYLAGEVDAAALTLAGEPWFTERGIEIVRGEVSSIDRQSRTLTMADGGVLAYDRLVLAMGSHPFVPPIPGADLRGVFTIRTRADVDTLLAQRKEGGRCVVIGGGLLGLEAAGAIQRRAMWITVLEGYGYLLPRQLTPEAGDMLRAVIEDRGIEVRSQVRVDAILGDGAVTGVRLASGEEIPADLVVLATGVRPNSHLARLCGLQVRRGLVVDDRLATTDRTIFAAGDLVEHDGDVHGIWPVAYAQGVVAGVNAAGGEAAYQPLPPSNQLKVMDVDLFSVGEVRAGDGSYLEFEDRADGAYRRVLCRDGRIVGAVLFGDTALANDLRDAIESGTQLAELTELGERIPTLGAYLERAYSPEKRNG